MSPLPSQSDSRLNQLHNWLQQQYQTTQFNIQPITNDASFRRYFRVTHNHQTMIAMDAPPTKENLAIFIAKARIFHSLRISIPKILAQDLEQGFLLLGDLGNDLYARILNQKNLTQLYDLAITTLTNIQTYVPQNFDIIPHYDEILLMRELQLFPTWYLTQKNLTINQDALDKIFKLLIDSALNQPQVLVHRDYHSRNLLLLPNHQLGVVDFQDAVFGPITYDLTSLLRDCYVTFPENIIENYKQQFYNRRKLNQKTTYEEFTRWFDWMGLQRHLKVLGLFTRLAQRDQKTVYLQDLPRVLNYVRTISGKYQEFAALSEALKM